MPTNTTTTIANQTATNSTITQQILHHIMALFKLVNQLIQNLLVPILAPKFGEPVARGLIYALLIGMAIYGLRKVSDRLWSWVILAALVLLIGGALWGGGG